MPVAIQADKAAIVGNVETPHRKHTNHMIPGPDYSIIHRGLFPHHLTGVREEHEPRDKGLATLREWLSFDDIAGDQLFFNTATAESKRSGGCAGAF